MFGKRNPEEVQQAVTELFAFARDTLDKTYTSVTGLVDHAFALADNFVDDVQKATEANLGKTGGEATSAPQAKSEPVSEADRMRDDIVNYKVKRDGLSEEHFIVAYWRKPANEGGPSDAMIRSMWGALPPDARTARRGGSPL